MHDIASRLAGRGVSGDQIRDDTKDRDVHRLQPLLHMQTQTCGRTTGAPRRRPAAIRTEALSIFKSTEENWLRKLKAN